MGRIFIWAGHRTITSRITYDLNSASKASMATKQMILLQDVLIAELRSRGCEVLGVPEDLDVANTITWINERCLAGDIALAIQANAFSAPSFRGTSVFYLAHNLERKKHAELMLLLLVRRLPQIFNHGSWPDTATELGKLNFCRQVTIPSLLVEVGCLENPEDRDLIFNQRRKIALGLADGAIAWSREVSGIEPNTPSNSAFTVIVPSYHYINIQLNNQIYDEEGIIVENNPYIPIDLVDRLGIDLTQVEDILLVEYHGVVYVKAVDLRNFNIAVSWEHRNSTIIVRSILPVNLERMQKIIGQGITSELQLFLFLKAHNEKALTDFPELPKLYREEGTIEGVNYDLAFAQMCLETDFLRRSNGEHNFAKLGAVGGKQQEASFSSSRLGVRAHIQHLKAYASLEPLVQELADPRFYLVRRGVADNVFKLARRWSADPNYGDKIMAMLRRLYESANFF